MELGQDEYLVTPADLFPSRHPPLTHPTPLLQSLFSPTTNPEIIVDCLPFSIEIQNRSSSSRRDSESALSFLSVGRNLTSLSYQRDLETDIGVYCQ